MNRSALWYPAIAVGLLVCGVAAALEDSVTVKPDHDLAAQGWLNANQVGSRDGNNFGYFTLAGESQGVVHLIQTQSDGSTQGSGTSYANSSAISGGASGSATLTGQTSKVLVSCGCIKMGPTRMFQVATLAAGSGGICGTPTGGCFSYLDGSGTASCGNQLAGTNCNIPGVSAGDHTVRTHVNSGAGAGQETTCTATCPV